MRDTTGNTATKFMPGKFRSICIHWFHLLVSQIGRACYNQSLFLRELEINTTYCSICIHWNKLPSHATNANLSLLSHLAASYPSPTVFLIQLFYVDAYVKHFAVETR